MNLQDLQDRLNKVRAEGVRANHRQRLYAQRRPPQARTLTYRECLPHAERFWSNVDRGDDCWLWLGAKRSVGHGTFYIDGRLEYAHRIAWVLTNQADLNSSIRLRRLPHNCQCEYCVNPDHYLAKPSPTLPKHGVTIDVSASELD